MIEKAVICLSIIALMGLVQSAPLGGELFFGPPPINDVSILEVGRGYNTYEHQQQRQARERAIRPLLDTITEEEKYGNDGGKIRGASVALVHLTENVAGVVTNKFGPPNENRYNLLQGFAPILVNIGNAIAGI